MPLAAAGRVRLVALDEAHRAPVIAAVRRSRALHQPWMGPPDDDASFRGWLERARAEDFEALVVERLDDGALVGAVNISQIFYKAFRSAYLSYWAAADQARQGLMTEGLSLALDHAFGPLSLHRLEANIQPGNHASVALVRRLGFRREGFSPRYLHIAGAWRDHERWAITAEDRGHPTPPEVQLERLDEGQPQRLRVLRLQALLDAPEAFGSSFDEVVSRPPESWPQQLRDLPTWVAVARGRDVGLVRAARDPDAPDAAWLISMWVAPRARGQGVGDLLVRAVIDWARAEGLRQLQLDVGDHNPKAAALYARHGFAPTGERAPMPPPHAHLSEHRRALRLR